MSARNLALLESSYEAAWPYYVQAWETLNADWQHDPAFSRLRLNLASEMLYFTQTVNWLTEMEWMLEQIPEELSSLDAVTTSQIKIALSKEDAETTLDILAAYCFPTYARERSDLIDMWNTAQEMLKSQQLERALSNVEKHQARVQNPPPRNIGCPYADLFCSTYW